MINIKFLQIILIIFPLFVLNAEKDILFILFDAGETNALLPVIEKLEDKECAVLAFGTSRKLLSDSISSKIVPTDICEQVDASWDRTQPLSNKSIQAIANTVNPQIVVTGVASTLQGQFLEHFSHNKQITLYAYRDNINYGTTGWHSFAEQIQRHIPAFKNGAVLFPSEMVSQKFSCEKYRRLVVGKPSFDQLRAKIMDPHLRQKVRAQLGVKEDEILLTWVGGYDEPGKNNYAKALELFKCSPLPSNMRVLFHQHPKVLTQAEKQSQLPVAEILAATDLVATYQSSLGLEALLCGKQLFYFVPEGDREFSPPIELANGWAKRISTPEEFVEKIHSISLPKNLIEIIGILQDSVSLLLNLLRFKN